MITHKSLGSVWDSMVLGSERIFRSRETLRTSSRHPGSPVSRPLPRTIEPVLVNSGERQSNKKKTIELVMAVNIEHPSESEKNEPTSESEMLNS